jgi:2-oxoglutarate ferredoxin oxidoreductase subunit alpha
MVEARDQLRGMGIPTGYLLLKALPFTPHLASFVKQYRRLYVVEQNRDGQMADLVRTELPHEAARVRSVRHYTGMPIDAAAVTDEVVRQEGARIPAAAGATR